MALPSRSVNKSFAIGRSNRRLLWVSALLALAALSLVVRLVYLQVAIGADLTERARQQQLFELRPFIPRRTIVDRKGTPLAIDRPVYSLFAHPQLIKKDEDKSRDEKIDEIAQQLAPILNRPASELRSLLSQDTTSVRLEYWLSEEVADRVAALRYDGLDLVRQRRRVYPQKELAAEVLGYVNVDHRGQAGVELSQEPLLERVDRSSAVFQDGMGRLIPAAIPAGMLKSDRTSLQLTLDERLQRVARKALREQIDRYGAKRGAVMVMDARDGGMLALVTEPTYDPNRYNEYKKDDAEKRGLYKNWAVSDLYEPGSTFKPINVAIALEVGAIQPDDVLQDEGQLTIGGWPVANFDYETRGPVGPLSISQILQRSSNVGMVRIIQKMKPATYFGWLERIGLNDKTGIDLPSETPSTLKPQEQFVSYEIEPATAAFGQGFSLTPIQMVQLHGILASGGKLLQPHVVNALLNEEGEEYYRPKLMPPRQVFSPATTRTVLEMMTQVVEQGTGQPAKIPGYRLGGKTGTAQKADPAGGGYSNAKITSFVGIFPSEAPRYVVMAVIDEPKGDDAFGSTVAAPIVKATLEDLIAIENIPPSHPEELAKAVPPPPTVAEPVAEPADEPEPTADAIAPSPLPSESPDASTSEPPPSPNGAIADPAPPSPEPPP